MVSLPAQDVLEEFGSLYSRVAPPDPYVIRDGKLVTDPNQQLAADTATAQHTTGVTTARLYAEAEVSALCWHPGALMAAD